MFGARFVALLAVLFVSLAHAENWPNKPVRLIVPGPAGSAPDTVARLLGQRLEQVWVQAVVVENRPGAGGNIGTSAGAKAAPDGYTLTFGQSAPLALNISTYKSLPFDPVRDFAPIVSLGISPMMIAVNNSVPAKSLTQLIELAKSKPGSLNFATSNSKNIAHLTGVILAKQAGIDLVHVSYQSNGRAAGDTIEGRTQIYIDGIPPMAGYLRAGTLRVLAESSAHRLPNFPDVPAVSETVPGFEFNGWFCLLAPAQTSPDLVERINRDVNGVLKSTDLKARLESLGIYDAGGSVDELRQFLAKERARFSKAVADAGIEPD